MLLQLRDGKPSWPDDTDPKLLQRMRDAAAMLQKDLNAALDLAQDRGVDASVARLA